MTERETIAASQPVPGRTHRLKRNQALIPDDCDVIWYVENGVIDVQNSRYQDGVPIGGRRHLFQVLARSALFGHKPAKASDWQGWIGIAPTDTVVREVRLPDFASLCLKNDENCQGILSTWIHEISHFMSFGKEPSFSLVRAGEGGDFEHCQDETLSAPTGQLLLVLVRSGRLALLGLEGLEINPEDGPVLINPDLWLKVVSETAELTLHPLPAPVEPAELGNGLEMLHTLFCHYLQRLTEEEKQAEIKRRNVSKEKEELATTTALDDLSSVLNPQETFPLRETPLLTAVSVIGQVLGFKVLPPSASEDMNRLNDPLEAIARSSKFRMRKIILSPDWWKADTGPLLAYLGEERKPVALLPRGDGYDFVQPDIRQRQPLSAVGIANVNPDAYMLYRPLSDKLVGISDLLRFTMTGRGGDFLFIVALGVLTTLLGMIVPRVIGALVDTAIPSANRLYIYQLAMILTVAGVTSATFTYVQMMCTVRTGLIAEVTAQSALWDRLLKFSPQFFRRYSSGDLQTRVNAVSEISRELNAATMRPLVSGVLALLNFLLLWYYSWELAKIALWVGLLVLILIVIVGHFLRHLSLKLNDAEGQYNALVIQMIGGVAKIRVAGSEQRAFNHWLSKYVPQLRLMLKVQRFNDVISIFNLVLPPAAAAVLFWKAADLTVGAAGAGTGTISIGDFISFNTAFVLYLMGWTDMSNVVVKVLDVAAKGHRIKPILVERPEVKEDASDPGRLRGKIELQNITFRYAKDGPPILDNVSCEVNPGEYIAFVGPSGSGKSTLLRIILGFETPETGRVLYDGQDLFGLDVLAVRRQIGAVLQHGRVSAGNIIENVSNNARLSHAEIWDAVADAGLTEDVEKMPMGLHTMVSEGGSNLSGGQRQRLLIARALAIRPRIVMFDEATSALDNRTQAIVSEALDRRRVTRIVIAHRLSTIRLADRIYVLDKGKIVQKGGFEELTSHEGLFKDLMVRQMM